MLGHYRYFLPAAERLTVQIICLISLFRTTQFLQYSFALITVNVINTKNTNKHVLVIDNFIFMANVHAVFKLLRSAEDLAAAY